MIGCADFFSLMLNFFAFQSWFGWIFFSFIWKVAQWWLLRPLNRSAYIEWSKKKVKFRSRTEMNLCFGFSFTLILRCVRAVQFSIFKSSQRMISINNNSKPLTAFTCMLDNLMYRFVICINWLHWWNARFAVAGRMIAQKCMYKCFRLQSQYGKKWQTRIKHEYAAIWWAKFR